MRTRATRSAAVGSSRTRRPSRSRGDDQLIRTVPDGAFAKPMTMKEVLKEAKKFLPKGLPMLESPTAS